MPRVESKPEEKVPTVSITGTVEPRAQLGGQIGPKRKRNPVIVTPAWSYNEVPSGILSSLNLFKVCTQYRFRRLQLQSVPYVISMHCAVSWICKLYKTILYGVLYYS